MANNAERLFMCLFAILKTLFNEMSLHSFCQISNWMVFHIVELKNSLYILDSTALADTSLANIFF